MGTWEYLSTVGYTVGSLSTITNTRLLIADRSVSIVMPGRVEVRENRVFDKTLRIGPSI